MSDNLDRLIGVADSSITTNGFIHVDIANMKNTIRGVGVYLKTELQPAEKLKFEMLAGKLKKLNNITSSHFSSMKEIVDSSVFNPTLNTITNMMDSINSCMEHQTRDNFEVFEKIYNILKPIWVAYDWVSFLEQENTNPLTLAMSQDALKTRATFDSMRRCIDAVMGHILFLELFASGFLKNENATPFFEADRIIERFDEMNETLEAAKNQYMESPLFFDGFEEYLKNFLHENSSLAKPELADKLKEEIEHLTLARFPMFIVLYNSPNSDDQVDTSTKHYGQLLKVASGKNEVIIYRTKDAYSDTDQSMETLSQQNIALLNSFTMPPNTIKEMSKVLLNTHYTDAGCVLAIDGALEMEARSLHSRNRQFGMGAFTRLTSILDPAKFVDVIVSCV